MDSLPESELIRRCRAGEGAAWDMLFDRHYEPAARFVWQLSGTFSREDVEEICQETFLAVVQNLDQFSGQSQVQTWIFRIAANKARDYRDRTNAAKRGGGQIVLSLNAEDSETGLAHDAPSPAPSPDAILSQAEHAGLVRAALEQVGEPCQEVIQLRYFADLSYDEIAGALELNAKTVSSRLSKCLDRLEEIARKIFSREKAAVFPSNPHQDT